MLDRGAQDSALPSKDPSHFLLTVPRTLYYCLGNITETPD